MALNFLNDAYFAGKVGIGTASPSSKLVVAKNINPAITILDTTTIPAGTQNAGNNITFGTLQFQWGAESYSYMPSIEARFNETDASFGRKAGLDFKVGNIGSVTAMSILSDGNVGIGTTNPSDTLTVIGDVRVTGILKLASGSAGSPSLAHRSDENTGLFFPANDNIGFTTSNTERMRITSTGGISFGSTGTAYGTSGQILKSNGNASPTWIDGSAIPGVPAGSGTLNKVTMWTPNGNTLGDGPITFSGNNSSFAGNVGIGVAAHSTYALDIQGTSGLALRFYNGTTFKSGMQAVTTAGEMIASSAVDDFAIRANAGSMLFATGGNTERMRILANGNVGIGETNPSQKLVVDGSNHFVTFKNPSTTANHYAQMLLQAGDASNYIWTANQNSTNWAGARSLNIYTSTTGANIGFFTEGDATNTKLMILGNGNVGIGTNSPGEALEVVGNIKIQSALLSNQENTDVDTGTETVAEVSTAAFTAAFFDFVIKKTTNVRSGTVYACHDGTTVQFTETSTQDLGDTSDVTLSVDISGGNMRLRATTTSDDWSIKSLIRAI